MKIKVKRRKKPKSAGIVNLIVESERKALVKVAGIDHLILESRRGFVPAQTELRKRFDQRIEKRIEREAKNNNLIRFPRKILKSEAFKHLVKRIRQSQSKPKTLNANMNNMIHQSVKDAFKARFPFLYKKKR